MHMVASVCLSALSWLSRLTSDLDLWHGDQVNPHTLFKKNLLIWFCGVHADPASLF